MRKKKYSAKRAEGALVPFSAANEKPALGYISYSYSTTILIITAINYQAHSLFVHSLSTH